MRAARGHTLERCAVTLSCLKHFVAVGCRTVHGLSGLSCLSAYATKKHLAQKWLICPAYRYLAIRMCEAIERPPGPWRAIVMQYHSVCTSTARG